jgi:hypothetical protein
MSLAGSHFILRLCVGALRQQRPNHLHLAVLRGDKQRRRSDLPHERAAPSAPPSAILLRTSRLPTHMHNATVAIKPRHCVPLFTRLLSAPQPSCPRAPPPSHAVAARPAPATTQPSGTFKQLVVPLCAAGAVLCMAQPPHPQLLPNSLRPGPAHDPACLPILVMAYHVSICWYRSRPCSCPAMRPCSLPGEPSRFSITFT